jgi:XTP/dITP diphosphohydrolase
MSMDNIVFYTGNKGKVKEIKNELNKLKINKEIIMKDIDIPEIQSISNRVVIIEKLKTIKKLMTDEELKSQSFIVEDTGLYIDNMNNFPGALIKFYLDSVGTSGISKFNGNSKAKAETWIGLWNAIKQKDVYFFGSVKGLIAIEPRGNNGFGYDPIFIPNNINEYDIQRSKDENYIHKKNTENKTYAELSDDDKSKCNQRTIAGYKLAKYLQYC